TASAREMLDIVSDCARRLQDLANTVLGLARPAGAPLEDVEVCRTLDSALRLMEFRTRGHVEVVRDFRFEGTVPGEPAALGQVWINLFDNALRAMPAGGRLTVATREVDGACEITVGDSGGGIAPGVLPNLFQPFFTTRSAGEGTGLGLSMCRQIVERARGSIRVRETSTAGTTFEVRLPLAEPAAQLLTGTA
ncbi:MAG: sensor histidine kinase, partial [Myxococcales bacterium]